MCCSCGLITGVIINNVFNIVGEFYPILCIIGVVSMATTRSYQPYCFCNHIVHFVADYCWRIQTFLLNRLSSLNAVPWSLSLRCLFHKVWLQCTLSFSFTSTTCPLVDEERTWGQSVMILLVGISALSFPQCFDTVGWVTGRGSSL